MSEKKATNTYSLKTRIAAPAEEVFDWHSRPGALERLLPPWRKIRVIHRDSSLDIGSRVHLQIGLGPFKITWIVEHKNCLPKREFVDAQVKGPFKYWRHRHLFHAIDAKNCEMEDVLHYTPPAGALGRLVANRLLQKDLARGFTYRHRIVSLDLAALQKHNEVPKQRILVSGATGLIGSALVPFLRAAGHQVWILTRSEPSDVHTVRWSPTEGQIEEEKLENFDTVIHLAGENIAGRWTKEKKARIHDSRVNGTRLLVNALNRQLHPPKTFIGASAIGYYGDRGDEILTESSSLGKGYLPSVCEEWEQAAKEFTGGRVVHARLGVVLSYSGGALKQMLTPFKLGVGGTVGSGDQYMSWIAIDDVVYQLYHLIANEGLTGPFNLVSPNCVTNAEFTKILGRVLQRPTVLPLPAFVVKAVFGEMGENLLLGSSRVEPTQLESSNASFAYPDLEQCLRHLLGRRKLRKTGA